MSALDRLARWYHGHCDGDWEHQSRVSIQSLDNPGWSVTINVAGTELEDIPFATFEKNYEHRTTWMRCWREGTNFRAACGPLRLGDVLEEFAKWADGHQHSA